MYVFYEFIDKHFAVISVQITGNKNYCYRSTIGRLFLPILSTIGLSDFHTIILNLIYIL